MILNNAQLVTLWHSQPFVETALVAMEGKTIVDFGKVGKLVDRYEDAEILDVGGRLVLPGMVNAHTRMVPGPLSARLEKYLDEESLYWTTALSLLEALRSGTTTVFLSVSSPAFVEGSLEAVARAFRDVGARGSISQVVSPRSATHVVLRENLRHLESCRGASAEWMQGLIGIELSDALDEEMIGAALDVSDQSGAGFHVVSSANGDAGTGGLERLERAGLWSRGGVAALREPAHLRGEDVFFVHCPQSEAVAGVASKDLLRDGSGGTGLGLGTDGCGQSLFEELLAAAYRQRAQGHELAEAVRRAYGAGLVGNPDLATRRFGYELGRVKPGARADLVVLDYWPSAGLRETSVHELLFWGAWRAPVHAVIVNGRLLYHNGRFVALDEERVRARAREAVTKLWERI